MVQTLAAPVTRPIVSMFARCAYCPALTSFSCLSCGTAMCPACVRGDYCPECQPAPVAPLMGWSMVREGHAEDDATWYAAACATCGDTFRTEDPDDDTLCAACAMDPAEVAALRMVPAPVARPACAMCGGILTAQDTTRCAVCARFMARLDADHAAWKEDRLIAA